MTIYPRLPDAYKLGVVEGFFGSPWSWQARFDYAPFLSKNGFNSYIYAPKADEYLRKGWKLPFTKDHTDRLTRLSLHFRENHLDFGMGLSPFEIYKDFSLTNKKKLLNKITALNDIGLNTFCLLFDDMPGSINELAERQCEVMDFIMNHCKAQSYIFCPTYYSFDPILAKHFGDPPENYLESLGNLLPQNISIFWTGPRVVSEDYPDSHLNDIKALIKRKPTIWDNYPVNDSEAMCNYLHLSPRNYNTETLKSKCSGHYCNPMNQPYLSQIPLKSLAAKYFNSKGSDHAANISKENNIPNELQDLLLQHLQEFERVGLKNISQNKIKDIKTSFSEWQDHPVVNEISDWMDGKYTFDPNCLT